MIALVVLILFLPSYTKMSDLQRKNEEYNQELIELKKKNALLKQEKYLLEKDPDYLEKVAREKMGLVKEGEVVYRLMPANAVSEKATTLEPKSPPKTTSQSKQPVLKK